MTTTEAVQPALFEVAAPRENPTADVVFTVRGLPAPQGSKRAFRNKYSGRIQQVESSAKVAPWRSDVKDAAEKAMGDRPPLEGPLTLWVEFRFPRPKGHRGVRGLLPSAPLVHAQIPDLSKLIRAIEDAMTTIVWRSDAQVSEVIAHKLWDDVHPPGATVRVSVLRP